MMRATYFWAAGLAAISAAFSLPCQAQMLADLIPNVTDNNQIIIPTEIQDIDNSSVGDSAPNINTSKSFSISETTSIPAHSSLVASPNESQPLRSNPLGCRFFYTPSMQQ